MRSVKGRSLTSSLDCTVDFYFILQLYDSGPSTSGTASQVKGRVVFHCFSKVESRSIYRDAVSLHTFHEWVTNSTA
ncbi:hypothetical protein Ciccas_001228 [Cichlidogyrus casuarinus]|uniref:Uncharacterized protein n=1 Tax=Cichlidogyrus casuarinus TaxID=1844966 RepID=A0ABD2QNP3_9PLAT